MPPAFIVEIDEEAFRHLWDLLAFHPIADRAWFTRCAADACTRPFPRKLAVSLADPAAIVAARAAPHDL